jgi:hypothetical protein
LWGYFVLECLFYVLKLWHEVSLVYYSVNKLSLG